MNNLLNATPTLNSNLGEILTKIQELMNSFGLYIILALVAVVVVWGAYIGIRIAIAHRNEEKINSRDMLKNFFIGILVIFVVAVGAPLLINGLAAWAGISLTETAAVALPLVV